MTLDIPDIATVGAAICAGFAIVQASLLQRKAMQPYVVVALTPNKSVPSVIEVGIKNYGPTAARDIQVRTDVVPMRPRHHGETEPQPLELPEIAQLGPGEEWTTVWGHLKQVRAVNTGRAFWGEVTFVGQGQSWRTLGIKRKCLKNEFPLDLKAFDERSRLDEKGLHDIGKDVRDILERLGGPMSRVTRKIGGTSFPAPLETKPTVQN